MDKLTLFIAVTSAAVVLQMFILLAMFLAVRKLGARMEVVANKVEDTITVVQTRALPLIDNANTIQQDVKNFLDTAKPRIETIIDNASSVSATARTTWSASISRPMTPSIGFALQVIRGNEMLTRTMDRGGNLGEGAAHGHVSRETGFRHCAGHQHRLRILFQHAKTPSQWRSVG